MNHWQETGEIVARISELQVIGKRAAIATVVHISGSAYRRPGAKLLIEESGGTLGSVSGGCLEADVREVAREVLATDIPSLRHYRTGSDEDIVWGLGLGCNGRVDVFIQPATEGAFAAAVGELRERLAGETPFAIVTAVSGADAGAVYVTDAGRVATAEGQFVEELPAPPFLLVCGAGDDARPLVSYASEVGFRVAVVDHRPALLEPAWFTRAARLLHGRPGEVKIDLPAGAFAVVKTHSLAHDREWARHLLAAGLPYVGLLGPRWRTAAILAEIGAGPADAARVFGPVGLDLGADGPCQVALSIVAELLSQVAGREPRPLRTLEEPIHAL